MVLIIVEQHISFFHGFDEIFMIEFARSAFLITLSLFDHFFEQLLHHYKHVGAFISFVASLDMFITQNSLPEW